MARYIDIDDFRKNAYYADTDLDIGVYLAEHGYADVAPREDVEYWKEQCFNACMNNGCLDKAIVDAAVARKIFEETMRAMESGIAEADKAVINNTSILDFRESLCRAGEMYAGYIGVAICKVFQKYTEGQK